MQVLVRDNNVDQALRVLKKKMQREGVFREMKQRRSYEKPSERKTREKSEAYSPGAQARSEAGHQGRFAAGAPQEEASRAQAALAADRRQGARLASATVPRER
jgi:small subunit ribosomal protein S21